MNRSRDHSLGCRCWQCLAQVLGVWLDELGNRTKAGAWQIFLTITYSMICYPWARGFPGSRSGRPGAGYGDYCFKLFVSDLSAQLGSQIEHVVTDQYGSLNGRFHQHALLSAIGLDRYPRCALENWLRKKAGWSRALPFEHGAAFYIAKYLGRNLQDANWQVQVGSEVITRKPDHAGRVVIAESADLPRALFHQNFPRRKK
jgi:hypothetical protein